MITNATDRLKFNEDAALTEVYSGLLESMIASYLALLALVTAVDPVNMT